MIRAIFSFISKNKNHLSEEEAREYLKHNSRKNIEDCTHKYNRIKRKLIDAYNDDRYSIVNHLEGFLPYYQHQINYEKSVLSTIRHNFISLFSLRKFQYKEIDRLHALNTIDFELEKAKREYEDRNYFDPVIKEILTTDLI